MRFIKDDAAPFDAVQFGAIAVDQGITGNHQLLIFHRWLEGFFLGPFVAVVDQGFEAGAKAFHLPLPIAQHRSGTNQQRRRVKVVRFLQMQQKGNELNGFAQPHVVGQASSQSPPFQKGQPGRAPSLVRPQLAPESRWFF